MQNKNDTLAVELERAAIADAQREIRGRAPTNQAAEIIGAIATDDGKEAARTVFITALHRLNDHTRHRRIGWSATKTGPFGRCPAAGFAFKVNSKGGFRLPHIKRAVDILHRESQRRQIDTKIAILRRSE